MDTDVKDTSKADDLKLLNKERVPMTPPVIHPIADDVQRPLWSVMVPVYNSINYLEETLQSVLTQDPGQDKMEIIVVDDISKDGDVAALVERVGMGRVGFYQHEQNQGHIRNFEHCIQIAKGHYVLLLHGDDVLKKGFFTEIESLFDEFPEAGAAFTDFEYMDDHGKTLWGNDKIAQNKCIPDNLVETFAEKVRTQYCCMVVKRSTYELTGSFYGTDYGEDWIMWVRLASFVKIAYTPSVLARYRILSSGITGSSSKSGINFTKARKNIETISGYLPESSRARIRKKSMTMVAVNNARMAHRVYHEGNDPQAALQKAWRALKFYPTAEVFKYGIVLLLKVCTGYRKWKQ